MSDVLIASHVVCIAWAKTRTAITDFVATGHGGPAIASSLPDGPDTPMPFLVFAPLAGSLDVPSAENIAIVDSYIQVAPYGLNKADSSDLSQIVQAEARDFMNQAQKDFDGSRIYGMRILAGSRRITERDHKFIRHPFDLAVTYRSA